MTAIASFLYAAVCKAYNLFLRELVKKAIDDPNSEWDDLALRALDAIFAFAGGGGVKFSWGGLAGFMYTVACEAYEEFIRELILKAIDDPDEEWDDLSMKAMDFIFQYKEEE